MPAPGEKIRSTDIDQALVGNTSAFHGKRFEVGTVSVTTSVGPSYFTEPVTFEDPFNEVPVVTVSLKQGSGGSICMVGGVVADPTVDGFTAYLRSGDDGALGGAVTYDMDWIAVGS